MLVNEMFSCVYKCVIDGSLQRLYNKTIVNPITSGTRASTPWACLSKPLQTELFRHGIVCKQNLKSHTELEKKERDT